MQRFKDFNYKEPVAVAVMLLTSVALLAIGHKPLANGLLLVMGIIGVIPIVIEMIKSVLAKSFGIDILAVTAIVAALALGEYLAAGVVLLMLTGGEALEDYAQERAKKELTDLLNRAPKVAHKKRGQGSVDVAVSDIVPGDVLIVKPGETVPVDAALVDGLTSFDESAITGESLPVEKEIGDELLSGSVNQAGLVEIKALRSSGDSQYARIVKLVEEAASSRSPLIRLADRYSLQFTAVAYILAGLGWYLAGSPLRALEVLVVATPCPLLLATPVALVSGMSRAASYGIIMKSGAALERLAELKAIVFDKTGTLTKGAPEVHEIITQAGVSEAELLRLAAAVERLTVHTLGAAVVAAAKKRKLKLPEAVDLEESVGQGVTAVVDGTYVSVGKLGYLEHLGVKFPAAFKNHSDKMRQSGQTAIYVALQGKYAGIISFSDTVRDESATTLQRLRDLHLRKIALMTGDHAEVAAQIGGSLGIEPADIYADQRPEDKLSVFNTLSRHYRPIAMVGDGINDAPVLAASDIGIAMGAKGSTAASESADVVIMLDDLSRVPQAIMISRRAMKIAKQSIFVGIGLSVGLMIIALSGVIRPLVGAVLQELVDVVVILNALRARLSRF